MRKRRADVDSRGGSSSATVSEVLETRAGTITITVRHEMFSDRHCTGIVKEQLC